MPCSVSRAGGAAGGEDLDPAGGQGAGEVDDAGLVGDADQGAADGLHASRTCVVRVSGRAGPMALAQGRSRLDPQQALRRPGSDCRRVCSQDGLEQGALDLLDDQAVEVVDLVAVRCRAGSGAWRVRTHSLKGSRAIGLYHRASPVRSAGPHASVSYAASAVFMPLHPPVPGASSKKAPISALCCSGRLGLIDRLPEADRLGTVRRSTRRCACARCAPPARDAVEAVEPVEVRQQRVPDPGRGGSGSRVPVAR